jgi:hypothetical protein
MPMMVQVRDLHKESPARTHQPRLIGVCTRRGTSITSSPMSQPSASSSEVTSLMLIDADGNELVVERIEYGPHPLPLRSASPVATRQSKEPLLTVEESSVPAGAPRITQSDDSCRSNDSLRNAYYPITTADCETVPDQFFVVYSFDNVCDGGSTGAVEVRSCVPYYASSVPCSCCSSNVTVDDHRTGFQNG